MQHANRIRHESETGLLVTLAPAVAERHSLASHHPNRLQISAQVPFAQSVVKLDRVPPHGGSRLIPLLHHAAGLVHDPVKLHSRLPHACACPSCLPA